MKKEEIKFGDWQRILFGEAPPAYLLEVVVRVAIIYMLILIAMRFMGKRMTAEVSRTELVARVSLAAAVGLPIQRPARGLLGAAIIAIVIVFIGRWLAKLAYNKRWFEKAYQGRDAILVANGIIDTKRMNVVRITRERLFAELRSEGIRHLGQVKRLYMEASGEFSLVKNEEEPPGLAIIPEWDTDLRRQQQQTAVKLCKQCGTRWETAASKCQHCNSQEQETAILLPAKEAKAE